MIKMYEEFSKPKIKEKFYKNGQKRYEIWYLNGKLHREDGPSYQFWYENGQKRYEDWFLNNKRYTREEWINELKKLDQIIMKNRNFFMMLKNITSKDVFKNNI